MAGGNQMDRRDYDIAASQESQSQFERVASRLEALIGQRDADVRTAMADYEADGVSAEYHGKEVRWHGVADQVRTIISTLRSISPSAPRGPAISPPEASSTSPVALTAAITATVSPAPVVAAA